MVGGIKNHLQNFSKKEVRLLDIHKKSAMELIKDIAWDLELEDYPDISADKKHEFPSDTTLAQLCITDGSKIIYVRGYKDMTPDRIFAICHEMRHYWQIKTNDTRFLSGYKTTEQLNNVAYNLQLAELDANAYATMYMEDTFGITPLFEGMAPVVINAIRERIEQIEYEE